MYEDLLFYKRIFYSFLWWVIITFLVSLTHNKVIFITYLSVCSIIGIVLIIYVVILDIKGQKIILEEEDEEC